MESTNPKYVTITTQSSAVRLKCATLAWRRKTTFRELPDATYDLAAKQITPDSMFALWPIGQVWRPARAMGNAFLSSKNIL
jgi:hypothetical protein